MKSFGLLSGLFGAASLLASSVAAVDVDPIVIKGSHFFYQTNGSEFFMRGVAYQQNVNSNGTISGSDSSYSDPLADPSACARDIPRLVQLQTNIIRVYAVDPTKDHSQCMSMLASAGIYVIADLSTPNQAINRDDPSWNDDLYYRYTSVVDAFHNYTNVLGFFAGNEVSNLPNNTEASAYVKAAVRDTKAYIKRQNYRTIGVGYATYDGPIRDELSSYFNCGDSASAIDFFGYNIYSWCGNSDYVTSGYQERTNFFSNYSVPVFFAEYGCNTEGNRTFSEVQALYGPNMTPVWSGGIVYMYFQEENNYGLVSVSGNTVTPFSDFYALSSQLAMITPSSTAMSAYTPTNTAQACPTLGASWAAVASPLPPTPNRALCNCAASTYSCALAAGVATSKYGNLFNYICSANAGACTGIVSNATSGVYGAYSVCNSTEQLSYVMNAYYGLQANDAKASACNFNGAATTRNAVSATGTCSSILALAGTSGGGSVASPTGSSGAQVGSSSAASSGSHTGAANYIHAASLDFGMLQMGAYVVGAVLTGAGMILL